MMKGWLVAALAVAAFVLLGFAAMGGFGVPASNSPPVVVDRGEAAQLHAPAVQVESGPAYDEFGPDPTRRVDEPVPAVKPQTPKPTVSVTVASVPRVAKTAIKPSEPKEPALAESVPPFVTTPPSQPAVEPAAPRVEAPPERPRTRRLPIVVRRESSREREVRQLREQVEEDRKWRQRMFEKWAEEERERERRRELEAQEGDAEVEPPTP